MPVDLYGQAADVAAIAAVCDRWGVPVLADLGGRARRARQRGQPAGKGGRAAAFSFNGNKIVTAGGGGALCSDDADLIARARHLATQAKDPAAHYQHDTTGYSYGLSSVLAAIGLAQLPALARASLPAVPASPAMSQAWRICLASPSCPNPPGARPPAG